MLSVVVANVDSLLDVALKEMLSGLCDAHDFFPGSLHELLTVHILLEIDFDLTLHTIVELAVLLRGLLLLRVHIQQQEEIEVEALLAGGHLLANLLGDLVGLERRQPGEDGFVEHHVANGCRVCSGALLLSSLDHMGVDSRFLLMLLLDPRLLLCLFVEFLLVDEVQLELVLRVLQPVDEAQSLHQFLLIHLFIISDLNSNSLKCSKFPSPQVHSSIVSDSLQRPRGSSVSVWKENIFGNYGCFGETLEKMGTKLQNRKRKEEAAVVEGESARKWQERETKGLEECATKGKDLEKY